LFHFVGKALDTAALIWLESGADPKVFSGSWGTPRRP
jgi:hypothetical protein